MQYYIVGLGNPGNEYKETRHNVGRMALDAFRKKIKFPDWEFDKKLNAQVTEGKCGKHGAVLVLPETFMNKSGDSVKRIKNYESRIKAERFVVVHDDLDLPLGGMKIVFNRGSGGHRGVESIERAIKTREFTRIRIGISPKKKPNGDKRVNDFILGNFKPTELAVLKKVIKKASEALETIAIDGRERAMNAFN